MIANGHYWWWNYGPDDAGKITQLSDSSLSPFVFEGAGLTDVVNGLPRN